MRSVLIVLAVLGCGGKPDRWNCNADGVCWQDRAACKRSQKGAICTQVQDRVFCFAEASEAVCYATSEQCARLAKNVAELGVDVQGCVAR